MIALLTPLVWTFLVGGRSPQTKNKPSTICSVNDCCCPQNSQNTTIKRQNPLLLPATQFNPGNQTHKAYEIWVVAFVARSVIWSLFVRMQCKLCRTKSCLFCLSNHVAMIQEFILQCRSRPVWPRRPFWATWIQVYKNHFESLLRTVSHDLVADLIIRIEGSNWRLPFLFSGAVGRDPWFSDSSVHSTHWGLVNTQIAGPRPRVSDWVRAGWA